MLHNLVLKQLHHSTAQCKMLSVRMRLWSQIQNASLAGCWSKFEVRLDWEPMFSRMLFNFACMYVVFSSDCSLAWWELSHKVYTNSSSVKRINLSIRLIRTRREQYHRTKHIIIITVASCSFGKSIGRDAGVGSQLVSY